MRDAQLYRVGAGTQEIRRMLIGREFSESSSVFRFSRNVADDSATDNDFGIKG